MPTNIVEIPLVVPIQVPKLDQKCCELIADTEFDIGLSPNGSLPTNDATDSHKFENRGPIVRKMLTADRSMESRVDNILIGETGPDDEIETDSIEIVVNIARNPSQKPLLEVEGSTLPEFQPDSDNTISYRPDTNVPLKGIEIRNTASIPEIKMDSYEKPAIPTARLPTGVEIDRSETEENARPKQSDSAQNISLSESKTLKNIVVSTDSFQVVEKSVVAEIKVMTKEPQVFVADSSVGISQQPAAPKLIPFGSGSYSSINGTTRPSTHIILAQISSAISHTSKDSVEIRLDPPELGRVIITITQSESGLTAIVNSEKAEISDLLRRHSELLAREFSKSGFGETTLKFSHDERSSNDQKGESLQFEKSPDSQDEVAINSTIVISLHSLSGGLDIRL